MSIKHIFIAGFEKCGATALADWMLINHLVEDRVAGVMSKIKNHKKRRSMSGVFSEAQ